MPTIWIFCAPTRPSNWPAAGWPDTGRDLCSQPTLSRLENAPSLKDAIRLSYALVDQWMDSYERAPASVTLDIDDTCDVVHGLQDSRRRSGGAAWRQMERAQFWLVALQGGGKTGRQVGNVGGDRDAARSIGDASRRGLHQQPRTRALKQTAIKQGDGLKAGPLIARS